MAADSAAEGQARGWRKEGFGFFWEASSPSLAEVARMESLFPDVVTIPVEELASEAEDWKQNAIIARSFNRWVPAEAYLREFRRAGVPGSIVPISLAQRCHIFRFETKEACSSVMKRPWVINGQVIGLEAWRPDFFPAEDSIPVVMLWVRLPNLPLEFWKEDFLRLILGSAGEFIMADAATVAKSRGGFARVCMRIDLRHPLRPGVRIQGIKQLFW